MSHSSMTHHPESPPKRRYASTLRGAPPTSVSIPPEISAFHLHTVAASPAMVTDKENKMDEDANITISATSKLAGQTVAPFLARHIPEQYAPLGGSDRPSTPANKDPNTKYCYRHRPDLKCRRQVDEPSMDQLQHVGTSVQYLLKRLVSLTLLRRSSKHCPKTTSKPSLTSGPSSRLLHPNNEVSCFRGS